MKKQSALYQIAAHESCIRLNAIARYSGTTSPEFAAALEENRRLCERASMTLQDKIAAETILTKHGYNGTDRSVTPAYRSYRESIRPA